MIILFDGACNLCDATVRFFKRRDPHRVFEFVSQQSEPGRALAIRHGIDLSAQATILVLHENRVFRRSDATLAMIRHLPWPWRWLRAFALVPRPLRDAVYDFVARHRYRIFGRTDACEL